MSNYTKTTNFTSKDSLPSGNSDKIVKGSEIDTEFNNIQTAVATKLNTNDGALTGTTTFQTLSDGTIAVTAFVDEDNMASDSATLLPTQQSVKAYVDSQVTAQDLDFQADTGGALSIDLDSETLTFTGGTGVDTSGSGNAVTFAIDSTVATLTGTQTLSNKTLSTPVISGNLTTNGLIDGRDVATDGTKLDGIESGATGNQTAAEIKTAYESNADTNAFTDADHSKLDGIEASADVTDTANVTAAGALMDSELTAIASVKALNQGVATTDSPTFAGLTLGATALTATAAELNVLDGITSTTAELNILDGVTSTAAELNILDGVTSTAAELNILDGVTATATELNYVDGVTSAIQTQLDAKAALAGANFTGNVDVAGTLTTDAFSIEDATSPTLTLNDTTSANQKTTLSHTAGASVLTTGDNGVFGSFKVAAFDGTSTINRLLIADNGDVSLYEDGGATAKLVWDSSAEALEFADNAKAIFGAGSDLQIYHDGSNSYVKDAGTGQLILQGSTKVILKGVNGDNFLQGNEDGAVNLYHNDSQKLATTSTGIDVTGSVTADGLTVDGGTTLNTSSTVFANLNYSNSNLGKLSTDGINVNLEANANLFLKANSATRAKFDGNGDISFYNSSGTSQSFFWDSSAESLGIGTSSPSFPLHVSGSSTNYVMSETTGTGTSAGFRLKGDASADFTLFTTQGTNQFAIYDNAAASQRLTVDSSGNLALNSNGSVASLDGVAGMQIGNSSAGSAGVALETSNRGYLMYINGTSLAFWDSSNNSDRMRIDSSGNVGIGVTDVADAKLVVRSTGVDGTYDNVLSAQYSGNSNEHNVIGTTVSSTAANSGFIFKASDGGGSTGTTEVLKLTRAGAMFNDAGGDQDFRVESDAFSSALSVEGSSGKVNVAAHFGIGKTSAGETQSAGSGFFFVPGANGYYSHISTVDTANFSSYFNRKTQTGGFFSFAVNDVGVGSVTYNGTVTVYGTSSDERLKENIADAPSASDDIDAIQVRSFDWRANGLHQKYGMVAQELLSVAPEAIAQGDTEEDMMAVDYSKLVPMLVKEIQSLRARVAQLESN